MRGSPSGGGTQLRKCPWSRVTQETGEPPEGFERNGPQQRNVLGRVETSEEAAANIPVMAWLGLGWQQLRGVD